MTSATRTPIPKPIPYVPIIQSREDFVTQFVPVSKEERGEFNLNAKVTKDTLCKFCLETTRVLYLDTPKSYEYYQKLPNYNINRDLAADPDGYETDDLELKATLMSEYDYFAYEFPLAQLNKSVASGCHLCSIILHGLTKQYLYAEEHRSWSDPPSVSARKHRSLWKALPNDSQMKLVLRVQLDRGKPWSYIYSSIHSSGKQEFAYQLSVVSLQEQQMSRLPCQSIYTGSPECLDLLKLWIQQCTEHHPECVINEYSWSPTRLLEIIDLSSIRLIEPTVAVPYFALSYRWGKSRTFLCTTSRLSEFKNSILIADLPQTIADAIEVVQNLGGRHLWVDSLCIVQDDHTDWDRESKKMSMIYKNAFITLAAIGATDTSDGLFSCRDPFVAMDCELPYPPGLKPQYDTLKLIHGADLPQIFEHSALRERGWALQERALSPRTISFGPFLYWECHESFKSELDRDVAYERYGGDFMDHCHTMQFNHEDPNTYPYPSALRSWHSILGDYTGRQLSVWSDRLRAIQGMITEFQSRSGWHNTWGLWDNHLITELLWKSYMAKSSRIQGAPSWTWASVQSRITHGEFVYPLSTERYLHDVAHAIFDEFDSSVLVLRGTGFVLDHSDGGWRWNLSKSDHRDSHLCLEILVQEDLNERVESEILIYVPLQYSHRLEPSSCSSSGQTHGLCLLPTDKDSNLYRRVAYAHAYVGLTDDAKQLWGDMYYTKQLDFFPKDEEFRVV